MRAAMGAGTTFTPQKVTLFGKIPVIRYVCYDCGYLENWVENHEERSELLRAFGSHT